MRIAVQQGVVNAMSNISFSPSNVFTNNESENSSFIDNLVIAMKLAGVGEVNIDGDNITDK
jgi:hypothetical protein